MPVGSASDSVFIEGSLFLPRWASLTHNDWFKVSKSILGFRDPLFDSQDELPSQTTTVHNCPILSAKVLTHEETRREIHNYMWPVWLRK